MKDSRIILTVALCGILLCTGPRAWAGDPPQGSPGDTAATATLPSAKAPDAFGGGYQYAVYPPSVWTAQNKNNDTALPQGTGGYYIGPMTSSTDTTYWTAINLPFGASIDSAWGIVWDDDTFGYLTFLILVVETSEPGGSGGADRILAFNQTGAGSRPGYTELPVTLDPPVVVRLEVDADDDGNTHVGAWMMEFRIRRDQPFGDPVAFWGAVVRWHRTVSPAPATATFSDVPKHNWAFPFVEALAASGITAGCSEDPPLYCPDDPVTRAQMAVYLSAALGLHWPQ